MIRIGQEIQCLPYAGFFTMTSKLAISLLDMLTYQRFHFETCIWNKVDFSEMLAPTFSDLLPRRCPHTVDWIVEMHYTALYCIVLLWCCSNSTVHSFTCPRHWFPSPHYSKATATLFSSATRCKKYSFQLLYNVESTLTWCNIPQLLCRTVLWATGNVQG